MIKKLVFTVWAMACCTAVAHAAEPFSSRIPIFQRGASTFYVQGHFVGVGSVPLLVDTGAGYSVIDGHFFKQLSELGQAHYVKQLRGVLADGSKKIVPVYRIAGIDLGGGCYIDSLEVAVFNNTKRMILGLNALRKVAPFAFSLEPEQPSLLLSNCRPPPLAENTG